MSPECKNLLKNILNTDPTRRYKIKDIRQDPWYNIVPPINDLNQGIIPGYHTIKANPVILEKIQEKYGLDPDDVSNDVEKDMFNDNCTTYYLILKRRERTGAIRSEFGYKGRKDSTIKSTVTPAAAVVKQ